MDKSILKRLGGPQSGAIVDLMSDIIAALTDVQAKLNLLVAAHNVAHTASEATSDVAVPTLE